MLLNPFKNPMEAQEKLLKNILEKNATTVYGKRYGFRNIRTLADYQRQAPPIAYEDIRPYIEALKEGKQHQLTAEPVVYYATTSGTTAPAKHIPLTSSFSRRLRKEYRLWAWHALKNHPSLPLGKALFFTGEKDECTVGGIPCGSISGYALRKLPKAVERRLATSPQRWQRKPYQERIFEQAVEALQQPVRAIICSSPLEILLFDDEVRNSYARIIKAISDQGNKKRAKELSAMPEPDIAKLWPKLSFISCVKSDEVYLQRLQELVGSAVAVRDPGIFASEGRISYCLTDEGRAGPLAVTSTFFEFKDDTGVYHTLGNLAEGETYEVLMTTQDGLYRYSLGDEVTMAGYHRSTPMVSFAGRKRCLDVAGEHLSEEQARKAVERAARKTGTHLAHYILAPNTLTKRPFYDVFVALAVEQEPALIERFSEALDQALKDYAFSYERMRGYFGRLDSPQVHVKKKAAFDRYYRSLADHASQFKPRILVDDQGLAGKLQ